MADQKGKNEKMNPVAQSITWTEAIKKENKTQKIWENFTINPKKLQIMSEKPNNNIMLNAKIGYNQQEKQAVQIQEDPAETLINEKLKTMNYTPKVKFDKPQTTNQDIGWYVQQNGAVEDDIPRSERFTYRRKQCDETNYANSYYTMLKKSPFSNLNK